ncbi:GNAT family protein [Draconibacterium halophilum]|uniref:GNAT family N-acetyltransferase n=1 Tax=Draconibacterium halophilum TaxID=2706887 RepID=A0A6C0RCQ6_9BACT|nr:GNAT family N-acetyltransferase [Draconibacterium halophilum]QIA06901.1 GNAT family N-acetyltransferase [Draconibacterium halophilum]
MTLQIKKIRIKELENFVNSKEFQNYEVVPISPIRAQSYLANPHAKPEDIVLYLGFIDNKLIAFRSLFADTLNSDGQLIRFGWCSGNWVHKQHRRFGYSEQLLREAYKDWNKKLLFTNYAPNSEKLYLKTGLFQAIHQFEGVRAYLHAKTAKFFPTKINPLTKLLFNVIDFFIGLIVRLITAFYHTKKDYKLSFIETEKPDETCFEFLKSNPVNSVFNRNETELKWIFEHPWISQQNNDESPATRFHPSLTIFITKPYSLSEKIKCSASLFSPFAKGI